MGRYYEGDINGKFWFGVQSSDDADFFGVTGSSNSLSYYFTEDDLPSIRDGIKECMEVLGDSKEKLDKFFKEKNSYNDKDIEKALGIEKEKESIKEFKVNEALEWYARLELGQEIEKCVVDNGDCSFEAEL